jgi:hypothetical protein
MPAQSRLVSHDIQELVIATLISMLSHATIADALGAQVLPLMVEILSAQPPASVAEAALQCTCELIYGRGDMCQLAADNRLLPTLQELRLKEYGEKFEFFSRSADAAMLHYKS